MICGMNLAEIEQIRGADLLMKMFRGICGLQSSFFTLNSTKVHTFPKLQHWETYMKWEPTILWNTLVIIEIYIVW